MKKIYLLFVLTLWLLCYGSVIYGAAKFDENLIFPGGTNSGDTGIQVNINIGGGTGNFEVDGIINEKNTLLEFIPRAINLILKIISPIVFVMFVYAGVRFIYAQENEEQINQSKKFFLYGAIGIVSIALSYSIMKVIYYILA